MRKVNEEQKKKIKSRQQKITEGAKRLNNKNRKTVCYRRVLWLVYLHHKLYKKDCRAVARSFLFVSFENVPINRNKICFLKQPLCV